MNLAEKNSAIRASFRSAPWDRTPLAPEIHASVHRLMGGADGE